MEEDVEHAIFDCDRWARVREECEMELGMRVNADNIIEKMLENEEGWMAIERMLVTIMKEKCEYEKKKKRSQAIINKDEHERNKLKRKDKCDKKEDENNWEQ